MHYFFLDHPSFTPYSQCHISLLRRLVRNAGQIVSLNDQAHWQQWRVAELPTESSTALV
jgi:hypothetical protein